MTRNRLQHEKSPYLLQHAANPVDWYPWGEAAFEKARKEDKPIFLSVGYSTCHWCHVMERESFENEQVAALLNETFVNIKVDREERPDIDAVYMKVCQLLTQSGGWPLTVMMMPDKNPFFAATYIPRETKYGRVGMLEMIPQVQSLWKTRRESVVSAASTIMQSLKQPDRQEGDDIGEDVLNRAYESFKMSYDPTYGGFGRAPKFPSPHQFFFLLRQAKRAGKDDALEMVRHTLDKMRRGGIYDHIGFGFHRYSTDERWIVPHFEKMLYDQALMAMAYIEVYQATGDKDYANTAHEIFTYVLRDLQDEQGVFHSAEDADSEGVEGKYYLWTPSEIQATLPADQAAWFLSRFHHVSDLEVDGMREIPQGHFIPHLDVTERTDRVRDDETARLETIRETLLELREKRVKPHRDDKILTDWNALMIVALARGARVFRSERYLDAASRAMQFIQNTLQTPDGRLLHRYRDGEAAIAGNLDDYAFVIWALLELYETTFDPQYLTDALAYQSHLATWFRDDRQGGYFFTARDAEALPTRPKELYDGAIPSGNSVSFLNTLKLSRMTGDVELDEEARAIYRAFTAQASAVPQGFSHFLCGLDFAVGPTSEVVIVGDIQQNDTQFLLRRLDESFEPGKVVICRPVGESSADIDMIAPYVAAYEMQNDRATAYVCSHFTCAPPTNDPDEMMALIRRDSENG